LYKVLGRYGSRKFYPRIKYQYRIERKTLTEQSYLPPPPPPKSSRKTLIIALLVAVVIVAAIVGAYLLTRSGANNQPTGTPTPTPSFTQSPSPTQTPTGAGNVSILSHSDYVDESGYYTLVGEVKNTLGTNVNYVKIVGTFYDSSGTVIGTDYTYTEIDILKPNQKSPFVLSSYPDIIKPASYKINVEYYVTQDQPFEGLTILSQTASIDTSGYHNIVGEVKNNGASAATYVKIVSTYYNSAGKVIGTSFTYTELDTINVGAASPFELSSYPLVLSPASYELQVQGVQG